MRKGGLIGLAAMAIGLSKISRINKDDKFKIFHFTTVCSKFVSALLLID